MTGTPGRAAILALDQGTTSTRALVVDEAGSIVAGARREHAQHFPRPGWVEHDALEIWTCAREVLAEAARAASGFDIVALGVTNQRETTVVWDRTTGDPVGPAIVWQDVRATAEVGEVADRIAPERLRLITGLPMDPYFSAYKLRWLLRHDPGLSARAEWGEVCVGTIDSWLVWRLTGGNAAGIHVTDVTNASRTGLMDLRTLEWSEEALEAFGVPAAVLPRIVPSSGVVGRLAADAVPELAGLPVAGILGDQQAAAFGQAVFAPGQSKCTYGTGSFLLANTGTEPVSSTSGLITTVAYQLRGEPARYALEGAVSVAGSLVQWMRDTLGIIDRAEQIEALAASVPDNGGVVIVPAFQGLLAPHWSPDATGAIMGLTRHSARGHLARAALEAVALQTCDVVAAMARDLAADPPAPRMRELRVDGGMAHNRLLLQVQADLLGHPVVRPREVETTALGAAFAAGLAVGVWGSLDQLAALWQAGERFVPALEEGERQATHTLWSSAISRIVERPLVYRAP